MSNAYDNDYYGTLDVTAYDQFGNEIEDATVSYEEAYDTKKGVDHMVDGLNGNVVPLNAGGFTVDSQTGVYTAWGDKGGSNGIKIEVSKDDVVKSKTQNISVQAISDSIWNDGVDEEEATLSYAVELSNSSIDAAGMLLDKPASATAMLVAKQGGKFVGYVRQDVNGDVIVGDNASAATGSSINIKNDSKISNIRAGVKYGNKYSVTGDIYDSAKNITTAKEDLIAEMVADMQNNEQLTRIIYKFYTAIKYKCE